MIGFSGFPEGKLRFTPIPNLFFSDLLPQIDNLDEMKVVLYSFWSLGQKEGPVRYMLLTDYINDPVFMKGMGPTPTIASEALLDGIERAVARGIFLHVTVESADGALELYFMNTDKGRAAVEGITRGDWRPLPDEAEIVGLMQERPNIFILYEQNIGSLTPLIADQLIDAEKTYSAEWIAEAIEIAVSSNVRKWRYILSILERWQQEGKSSGISRRDSKKELSRQVPDEYKGIVKQ